MTAWTDFVRKWSDKHNKSFACSMTDADCKKMYHATKAKKGKDLVKERRNEEAEKMGMAAEDHPALAPVKPAPVKPKKKTIHGLVQTDEKGITKRNFTKEELKQNAKDNVRRTIQIFKDLYHKAPEGEVENFMKKSVPALQAIAESIGAEYPSGRAGKNKHKYGWITSILEKKGYREDSPDFIRKREEAIKRNEELVKQYEDMKIAPKKRRK